MSVPTAPSKTSLRAKTIVQLKELGVNLRVPMEACRLKSGYLGVLYKHYGLPTRAADEKDEEEEVSS